MHDVYVPRTDLGLHIVTPVLHGVKEGETLVSFGSPETAVRAIRHIVLGQLNISGCDFPDSLSAEEILLLQDYQGWFDALGKNDESWFQWGEKLREEVEKLSAEQIMVYRGLLDDQALERAQREGRLKQQRLF
ncbi:MAG TPA: hypothetical protein ENI23_17160 [bacterium]|nr:hypothetical protein [bacterium]